MRLYSQNQQKNFMKCIEYKLKNVKGVESISLQTIWLFLKMLLSSWKEFLKMSARSVIHWNLLERIIVLLVEDVLQRWTIIVLG